MATDRNKDQKSRAGWLEKKLRELGEAMTGMAPQTADKIREKKKENCLKSGGKWVNGKCEF